MTELEKSLKNISIQFLNNWIENEKNPAKKELVRRLKEYKILSRKPKFSERVLVVKDSKFNFDGFKEKCNTIDNMIQTNSANFTRGYVEYDIRYRQLVGNGIFVKHENGKRFYGLLERKKGYTESSLIGNLGMVGGHLNVDDPTLMSGFIRECFEELKHLEFEMLSSVKHLGYIRESSTIDISNYHLCILYLVELNSNARVNNIKSSNNSEKLIWISESKVIEMIKNQQMSHIDSWAIEALKRVINIYEHDLSKPLIDAEEMHNICI